MEKTTNHKKTFGLIGKNINYSFSKKYFNEKFEKENILATYENFDCQNIHEVQHILNLNSVNGFNVTIPYKQSIIPFLDTISETAEQIGAVNCIEINSLGKKIGHNTDWKGFKKSIEPFISNNHQKALI
jgi:shikimate dehydrogenase